MRVAVLCYEGVKFRRHRIVSDGTETFLVRWLKSKRKWKRQRTYSDPDGYPRWKVEGRWITASLAVQQSFADSSNAALSGLLACHNSGTTRSDFGIDACVLDTPTANRQHRRRDGTHSTGHDTTPYKLSPEDVAKIVRLRTEDPKRNNVSALARQFGVERPAIRYWLKKRGITKAKGRAAGFVSA
jgi:Mitochondrial ribosomal protein subunit L20